jgi:hypothetical protein
MQAPTIRREQEAQVHVIEMITLFWLFFMTATFILQLKIPDPTSPASDGTLDLAAEDAFDSLAGATALDSSNHTSLLGEMLDSGDVDGACDMMLDSLPTSIRGNCWIAVDASSLDSYGTASMPEGRTLSIHHLINDSGHVWTVSLQVWHTGGNA